MTVLVVVTAGFVEEKLGSRPPEQPSGLCHGSQRDARGRGELNIVVTNDGYFLRHVHSVLQQVLDQSEGEKIVRAKHTGGTIALRQPEEPLAGVSALSDRRRRRLEVQQGVVTQPGHSDRFLRPRVTISDLGNCPGTSDKAKLAMANLKEVIRGHFTPRNVIDAYRTPLRSGVRGPIHQDDRNAEPA